MSTDPAQDYDVGYSKPPRQHRFAKGRSGNPSGRPKAKSRDLSTLLRKALDEKVIVNENGRRRAVPKIEAMTKQLVNKAIAGDARSIKLLVELLNQTPEAKSEPVVIYVSEDEYNV
jgi:Family of unknown function (DUF5681)